MAYMHVCPKCRSFFKVKTKDAAIRCPKCSYQYLLDLKMDDEAWGTLTSGEKKTIIKARVSEEGLTDVVASGSGPAKPASASQPSAGDENKQVRKTVKKVVKKKVVKRVVKKVVKKPEAALTEKEPVTDRKDVVREEALKEPVRKEEAAAEAAQTSEPEKRPDVRPEEKKIRQLESFLKAGKEKTGSDTEGACGRMEIHKKVSGTGAAPCKSSLSCGVASPLGQTDAILLDKHIGENTVSGANI